MYENIQLVLCDIDGTLLDDDRKISERTVKAIERLRNHGMLFGLASGRPSDELAKYPPNWGLDRDADVAIGMNGAELYDIINNQRYNYNLLQPETLKEIVVMMRPFNLNPYQYFHGKFRVSRLDEEVTASAVRADKNIEVIEKESDLYSEPNAKIMYRIRDLKLMAEVEEFVNAHPSKDWKAFKTQTTMLEFADPRVSKGYTTEQYSQVSGIPLENIMAFGDMTNDNDMLKVAGVGVCMKNGGEDTKACANVITEYTNNEDGWARFVEKYILEPRGW